MAVSLLALIVVVALMLAELWLSQRNERILIARGAVATADPVYRSMKLAYPGVFVAMALEGMLRDTQPGLVTAVGAVIFAAGKGLKAWAIASLGARWTYKVLVLPGAPLVTGGPYRLLRHPNYHGVIGELVGMALVTGALWTGPAGTLFFGWLLVRRIAAEEQALQLR
jgi:methyltransferase